MVRFLLLGILFMALAPAAFGDTWTEPAAVGDSGGYETPIVATHVGHEVVLAPMRSRSGAGRTHVSWASMLVRFDAQGREMARRPLALSAGSIVTYGRDGLLVAGSSSSDSGVGGANVVYGTGTGASLVGGVHPIAGARGQRVVALAADPHGDIALATVGVSSGRASCVVWSRSRGARFHAVLRVPVDPGAHDVALALGERGDVLLAWEARHEIVARHRNPAGRWGAPQRLGLGMQSNVSVAVDGADRLLVAWDAQSIDEGTAASPATMSYADAVGAHRFSAPHILATVPVTGAGRYVAAPGVRVVAGVGDRALLAWSGYDGAHFEVRVADLAGGRLGPSQRLSPDGQDAVLGDLAVGSGQTAVVLWRSGVRGHDATGLPEDPEHAAVEQVFASVRSRSQTMFGAPEAVSGPTTDVPESPYVAVDPATRSALAVFGETLPGQVLTAASATGLS